MGGMEPSLYSWHFLRYAERGEPALAISYFLLLEANIPHNPLHWLLSYAWKVQRYLVWIQARYSLHLIQDLAKLFCCSTALSSTFSPLQFCLVNFFGFVTFAPSEHFLSSTNTTAHGECMSYFKLALPHFWDVFCSGDPCTHTLSLGQFCKADQCQYRQLVTYQHKEEVETTFWCRAMLWQRA